LKAFILAHGHSNVPINYNGDKTLGRWCQTQKRRYRVFLDLTHQSKNDSTSYKRKTAPLTKEQIDKVQTVAFKFSAIHELVSIEMFKDDQRWSERFG
jgi:hypothetical protein